MQRQEAAAAALRQPGSEPLQLGGRALVGALLERGARVAFVARYRTAVERTLLAYPRAHGVVGDVSRKDDIHPIAIQCLGALGGLDVLANNASSLGPVPLATLADTAYPNWGAYGASKAALLHLGRIWDAALRVVDAIVSGLHQGDAVLITRDSRARRPPVWVISSPPRLLYNRSDAS